MAISIKEVNWGRDPAKKNSGADWKTLKFKPHQVIEDIGQNGMSYTVSVLKQTIETTSPTTHILTQIVDGHHPQFLPYGSRYFEKNIPVTIRKILITHMTFGDGSQEIAKREINLSQNVSPYDNRQWR